jgi:hypothetical protein
LRRGERAPTCTHALLSLLQLGEELEIPRDLSRHDDAIAGMPTKVECVVSEKKSAAVGDRQ